MKASEVRRAVIESTAFLFKDSILPPTYLVGKLFMVKCVEDRGTVGKVLGVAY